MEEENTESNAKVQELRSQLAASDALGQAASNDSKRLLAEKGVLVERVDNLESTLACARQEIDDRSQKYVAVSSQVDCVTPLLLGCTKPTYVVRYRRTLLHYRRIRS